jgi:hypothetical protein
VSETDITALSADDIGSHVDDRVIGALVDFLSQ